MPPAWTRGCEPAARSSTRTAGPRADAVPESRPQRQPIRERTLRKRTRTQPATSIPNANCSSVGLDHASNTTKMPFRRTVICVLACLILTLQMSPRPRPGKAHHFNFLIGTFGTCHQRFGDFNPQSGLSASATRSSAGIRNRAGDLLIGNYILDCMVGGALKQSKGKWHSLNVFYLFNNHRSRAYPFPQHETLSRVPGLYPM